MTLNDDGVVLGDEQREHAAFSMFKDELHIHCESGSDVAFYFANKDEIKRLRDYLNSLNLEE